MFAITGITGQVGGAVARALMEAGKDIRAVVRDVGKGAAWKQRGCEVAIASLDDAEALKKAFAGVEGVFFVLPPVFDPSPDFDEARRVIAAVLEALGQTLPGKLVSLSTIGAQSSRPNLLQQHSLQETSLGTLPLPVTFLRAAWFMENATWDVEPARTRGVIPSFLYPLDKPVPMVATADVGHLAAELLQESWQGKRIVELEGERLTPNEIALGFARVLGHDVRMEVVPRANWEALFRAQGMRNPLPRIQMLDGFNEGWIEFENPNKVRKGTVPLDAVLRELVARPLS